MKVATIMTADPVTVQKSSTVQRVMDLMDDHDVRHLPVVEGVEVVGVLSDRDVLEASGWLAPRQSEILEVPTPRVADLMRTPVLSCAPGDSLETLLRVFVEGRVGCLPVLQDGELRGIVTEVDLLRAYADGCRRGIVTPEEDAPVEEFMTPTPSSVGPDHACDEAASILRQGGFRHLPVVEGERVVGILSDRDLRRARGRGQLELTLVGELMTPEPQTARPSERLSSVALILSSERIGALPVVSGGRLVGLLSQLDVLAPCTRILQKHG